MAASDIILGDGVFAIGHSTSQTVDVALTRGGGTFTVEQTFREIEADGDYGPVQDRIRLIKSIPKLNMKSLQLLPYEWDSYHPAMSTTVTAALTAGTTATVTGVGLTTNVTTSDYGIASWTGYTKAGTKVYIEIQQAICLENIDLAMVDKEEILNELTFTAAYQSSARNTVPYKIIYTGA
jgi:hypothetical protein